MKNTAARFQTNWKHALVALIILVPLAFANLVVTLLCALAGIPLEHFMSETSVGIVVWTIRAILFLIPLYVLIRKKVPYPYLVSYILAAGLSFFAGPMD